MNVGGVSGYFGSAVSFGNQSLGAISVPRIAMAVAATSKAAGGGGQGLNTVTRALRP